MVLGPARALKTVACARTWASHTRNDLVKT